MMRSLIRKASVVAAVLLVAGVANAAPVAWTVDSSASLLNIGINGGALLGSGSGAGAVSGSANTDLTGTTLTLGANTLSIANITTTGTGLFNGVQINGVVASLANPNPINGVGNLYDLSGSTITLTSGVVILGGSTVFNFSTGPLGLALPSVVSTINNLGSSLEWLIPVNALVTFSTIGQTVTVTVAGNVRLTAIPEPGTVVLMVAGLAGLAAVARKRA